MARKPLLAGAHPSAPRRSRKHKKSIRRPGAGRGCRRPCAPACALAP